MKIPKLESPADPRPGPGWMPVQGSDGQPLKPYVRCNCGQVFSIRLHSVSKEGGVQASFHHAFKYGQNSPESGPGCGWHEFIELDGYDGPPFPVEAL